MAALRAFKTGLRETFVCDTFTTPDELGRKIAVTLSKYAAGLCRRRVLYTLRDRGEVLARDLIARAPQPGGSAAGMAPRCFADPGPSFAHLVQDDGGGIGALGAHAHDTLQGPQEGVEIGATRTGPTTPRHDVTAQYSPPDR